MGDSDRISAIDCKDSYFHFLLDEESQELFKFHGEDGIYRFKVLVMGTQSAIYASGELGHSPRVPWGQYYVLPFILDLDGTVLLAGCPRLN